MSVARFLGKTLDRVDHLGRSTIGRASNALTDAAIDGATRAFVQRTDAHFANAYTGLAPTKLATGVFTAGAAGYAYADYKRIDSRAKIMGETVYGGEPPTMTGDGIGMNSSNAPSLGASGNMVFGLNAMR